jgi:hypothetical protein
MAVAVKKQQAIRGLEAVAERPDGTRVPFLPFPTPIFNASGVFVGAVNMLVDITGAGQRPNANDSGRVREIRRRRNREVGQGDPRGQHQGRVT